MSWRILGLIKQIQEKDEEKETSKSCHCGSGKNLEDCHELEHFWPTHERPDPD